MAVGLRSAGRSFACDNMGRDARRRVGNHLLTNGAPDYGCPPVPQYIRAEANLQSLIGTSESGT